MTFLKGMCLAFLAVGVFAGEPHPALMDPSLAVETAPAQYRVLVKTTKGDFTIRVYRDWAPLGADRFYNLVKIGYYDNAPFYRVIDGFMAQWGFAANPKVSRKWNVATIKDEPAIKSNTPGMVSFAKRTPPDTRTTQLFVNTADNAYLDPMGFSPIGEVEGDGMTVVKALNSEYQRVDQSALMFRGLKFVKEQYPNMDLILTMELLPLEKTAE